MTLRALLCLGALSQLLGCSSGTEPYDDPPDDRGVLVAQFNDVNDLTWSTDGTEVYFIEGLFRIRAAPADGGTMRTVYTSNISIGHIVTAANKVFVAVAKIGPPGLVEWQVLRIDPNDSADVDSLVTYTGSVQSARLTVSDDERFVAFGDSLFDLMTATQRVLQAGIAWSFSPDGSQLLFEPQQTGSTTTLHAIATSDLSAQLLSSPSGIPNRTLASVGVHYWEGNDPKYLRLDGFSQQGRLKAFIHDGRSGTEREIASIDDEGSALAHQARISADGTRAVIFVGPFFRWAQLHAIDTETMADRVIATVAGGQNPFVTSVALSSDGAHAAYVMVEGGLGSGVLNVYVTH